MSEDSYTDDPQMILRGSSSQTLSLSRQGSMERYLFRRTEKFISVVKAEDHLRIKRVDDPQMILFSNTPGSTETLSDNFSVRQVAFH